MSIKIINLQGINRKKQSIHKVTSKKVYKCKENYL